MVFEGWKGLKETELNPQHRGEPEQFLPKK
jgi:hypothetical protein